jgi:hypothetical protein
MRIHGLIMDSFTVKTIIIMTGISSHKFSGPQSIIAIRYPKFQDSSHTLHSLRFSVALVYCNKTNITNYIEFDLQMLWRETVYANLRQRP